MRSIVVGVDGSETGAKALRWAASEARLRGAAIVALHAWRYPHAVDLVPIRSLDRVESDAQIVLQEALKAADDDLAGVLVEERVVYGEPGAALVQASKDADLVVVGSRGHGGFAGVLLGSVSQHVAHRAGCAVVIVR